jgi:CheY-like chemotaxis protein
VARQLVPAKSILIIDDSQDTLALNRMVLEMEGYEVFTASSGAQALTLLTQIEPPDLILLDMRMDGMSGPEFLETFERQQPEVFKLVPVVFLTGMDQVPVTKAQGFIRKPCEMDKFLKTVQQFLTGPGDAKKPSTHAINW